MTDKTLTENDETEDLIVVETPPPAEDTQPPAEDDKKPAPAAETEDDDDEDDGDERVGTSEDDNDEDVTAANRARRRKRRQLQKMAREKTERELAFLRERLAQLEGHVATTSTQTLEQKLAKTQQEIQQAEFILAKAVEAANGEDVAAAMRIRDELKDELRGLTAAKQQMAQQPRQAPQVDPRVVNYAQQWMAANSWYDPHGRDRESALTKAIDNELAQEGYDPASREYWEELTARVADAIGGGDEPAKKQTPDRPKRKAPPTGTTREHAPQSTKREIYVTPERKQAMIDAGVWDDPVLRQRYLKAYQAYDTGSAR